MSKPVVSIIGDGAMGTLCAIMLAENARSVRLWSAFADVAEELAETRENRRFLPCHTLPDSVEITGEDSEALVGAELVISAVPTQYMRSIWSRLKAHCPENVPICSVAKGIENKTLMRPTQILSDVLDDGKSTRPLAALSGPSIAPEVADKLPTSVTAASSDAELARRVQSLLSRPYFRAYTNPDVIGTEIAGASKNVIAIAAGVLDGLAAGDNAKAALITRGLVEITRLGVALGAKAETFSGLAGMGDLVTTCISPLGRNRSFGEAIGRGKTVAEALDAAKGVVEGVTTTDSIVDLAAGCEVDMPITEAVHDVLAGKTSPAEAITELMARPLKSES